MLRRGERVREPPPRTRPGFRPLEQPVARHKHAPGEAPADEVPAAGSEETDEERGAVPELLHKMMSAGFSGLFTTEAAIRGALGETLPRDWVEFLGEQSEKTRAEFAQRLAEEFGRVLHEADLAELAGQLLEGRTVEVKAEIRLGPRTGAGSRDENASPEKPAAKEERFR